MKFIDYLSLQEGINDPAIFKVIFLAGGPGSGKSFMAKKTGLQAMGFTSINSDNAFENLMRKNSLDMKMPDSESDKRNKVRDSAKETTDKKQQLALQGKLGMVIDGTGRDFDKIQKLAKRFEEQGYDTSMVFVNTDEKTALKRNSERERSVPEDLAKKLHAEVQGNIGKFQSEFGKNFHIIDNSEGGDFEEQTTRVFKDLGKWSKEPPKNRIAKAWISKNSPASAKKDNSADKSSSQPVKEPTSTDSADKSSSQPVKEPTSTDSADKSSSDPKSEPYKIKCADKRPPHGIKMANVTASSEKEALQKVRAHGLVPIEVNGRSLRESFLLYSTILESSCDLISMQQLNDLEKFGDRLLQKFNIDIEFTKHFGDRMSDERNKPCIKVAELQSLFKKIAKDKGVKVKQHADHEAVLKDIQSDLNLPFIAKPTRNGELELVLKTIMRKKNFMSPDPDVKY